MRASIPLTLLLLAACGKKSEPLPTPKADEEVVVVSVTGMT